MVPDDLSAGSRGRNLPRAQLTSRTRMIRIRGRGLRLRADRTTLHLLKQRLSVCHTCMGATLGVQELHLAARSPLRLPD